MYIGARVCRGLSDMMEHTVRREAVLCFHGDGRATNNMLAADKVAHTYAAIEVFVDDKCPINHSTNFFLFLI